MHATTKDVEDFKRYNLERYQALYEEGAAQERDRWRGIEAVAKDLDPQYEPMVKAMKADGRCTGGDLAQASLAMRRPLDFYEIQSLDRIAVQRDANKDWDGNAGLRLAFRNDQRMYVQYRVALARSA